MDLNRNYECASRNSLGSGRTKIELVPSSRPDGVTNLKSNFTNFMTANLEWLPGFNGGLPQSFNIKLNDTNYSVDNNTCINSEILTTTGGICIEKLSNSLVNVHNLALDSIYIIELSAYNKLGVSESSSPIRITTKALTIEDDAPLIPSFERLYLNVPRKLLEFTLNKSTLNNNNNSQITQLTTVYCFKLTTTPASTIAGAITVLRRSARVC